MANNVFEKNGKTVVMFDADKNFLKGLKKKEDAAKAFEAIMDNYLKKYTSHDMFMNSVAGDASSAQYYRFIGRNVLLKLDVQPLRSRNQEIWGGVQDQSCSIKGAALTAHIGRVKDKHMILDGEGKKREQYKNDIFLPILNSVIDDDDYTPVLSAILQGKKISETVGRYGEYNMPIFMCSGIQLYLFDPTKKRVEEASEGFLEFIDYIRRKTDLVADLGALVKSARMSVKGLNYKIDSPTGRYIREKRMELLHKADEIMERGVKKKFPGLEDKVLNYTNTGCYMTP